jgi:hypothetical protein
MKYVIVVLVLVLASSAFGFEMKAYQMKEDFGTAPLYDCRLNYYYYVPCPTYSWFWGFTGWQPGDVIGAWFQPGDQGTSGFDPCDPDSCVAIEKFRILDFAGYGTVYPGLFTVEFELWPSDYDGCPIGAGPIWSSGPFETSIGWNYIVPADPISIEGYNRVLLTATCLGSQGDYPTWAIDNVSTPVLTGCQLHDYCCLPLLYPRPYSSHFSTMHSGYYGEDFAICPPQWFKDARDTTHDGTTWGYAELTWRLYLICSGLSGVDGEAPGTSWSSIKALYEE